MDCFLSPVILTARKDKSVQIEIDSRKLNDSCIEKRPHMPIMEVLLNQISTEITRVQNEPLWISKTDLEYEYGQLNLSQGTSRQCKFAVI